VKAEKLISFSSVEKVVGDMIGISEVAQHMIVVNTKQTKSAPWIVKVYDPSKDSLSKMNDLYLKNGYTKMVLEKLVSAVESLPSVVRVPKKYSTLLFPRYYLVVFNVRNRTDESTYVVPESVEVVEIVGLKANKGPTAWSYRASYWHPTCQNLIASALRRALQAARGSQ
jgi:hypothetical protein